MAETYLELSGLEHCPLRKAELEKILAETIASTPLGPLQKRFGVSAAFVSSGAIRKLNRAYRGKDQATDVLSFAEYPDTKSVMRQPGRDIFLGELLIGFSFVSKSARMSKISFRRETAFVFAHGILHLVGMRHGQRMFSLQDKVIQDIN